MAELADMSAAELLQVYASHEASPVEATRACLKQMETFEPQINAVLTYCADQALSAAHESEARWLKGDVRALEGVPFGLKDIIATSGIRTTGGSRLYADYLPADHAVVADRLLDAGGVLLAKLQTFEFAFGADPAYGRTANPWDLERTPGGSSSGSAAALAAREIPFALGTDTGGSIRVPATFCGVCGLKPTFGRVPRTGVMGLSWSLDHVGPMARSVSDIALVLSVISGHHPSDPTSSESVVEDYSGALEGGARGLRIGIPRDWFFDVCDSEIKSSTEAAVRELELAGAHIVEVDLPHAHLSDPTTVGWLIIYPECASLHELDNERLNEYGNEFAQLLINAQFVNAIDYLRALRLRHLIQLDFQAAFTKVDAIITPGAAAVAPRFADMLVRIGDKDYDWLEVIPRTTTIFNMTGMPALSIPSGLSSTGLPIGFQIAATPFHDATCLRVGHVYQQLTEHHRARPPLITDLSPIGKTTGGGPTKS